MPPCGIQCYQQPHVGPQVGRTSWRNPCSPSETLALHQRPLWADMGQRRSTRACQKQEQGPKQSHREITGAHEGSLCPKVRLGEEGERKRQTGEEGCGNIPGSARAGEKKNAAHLQLDSGRGRIGRLLSRMDASPNSSWQSHARV